MVVFNNGTLGFVEMKMKVEGILDAYTKLKNPDFAKLAEVIGFGGWRVEHNQDLEGAVREFLAHPGPALLDVLVNGMELVMPPAVDKTQVLSTRALRRQGHPERPGRRCCRTRRKQPS